MKDQQTALEWVHDNVSKFNGDPSNICLFGESAGSACVHLQVLNKKSRKFISSAICQSGTANSYWNFAGQDEGTVKSLAKLLGNESDSIDDVYETLMAASVKDLYDFCDKAESPGGPAGVLYKWRNVIEEESDDAFITKSSIESLVSQAGQINIPMIFGSNDGDGMPSIAKMIVHKKIDFMNKKLAFMIPTSIKLRSRTEANEMDQCIRNFYLNGQDVSMDNIVEFLKLRTDVDYLIDQTIAQELNVRFQPGCKQFLYEFQFDGKLNLQKKQMKLEHLPFSGHADDVFHLFGGEWADKVELDEDSRECKMRAMMCKLWTNFAKYGDPTPDHDNPLQFKWNSVQPFTKTATEVDFDYLVINDEMKMVRNLNKNRMDFWRKVYKKWNKTSWRNSTSKL
jgi:carboxylesterase type B